MSVVFSKTVGKNDALYGKFDAPIRMIIQAESNAYKKDSDILNLICNVEKSNRHSEAILGTSEFDTFEAVKEGQGAPNDSIEQTYSKVIEHVPYMKEFTMTREMADDAKSLPAEIKSKARGMVKAYIKTRTKVACKALANATVSTCKINKAAVDLTTYDKLPLFHNKHKYTLDTNSKLTQANYFYASDLCKSTQSLENALNLLANKMRNFKDENLDALGYVPDIIILPCNRPALEKRVKQVIGSERSAGTNFNDINTQYGNWTIAILPNWETEDDRFILMSSEANANLMGSMFYNRVKLDITSWVDNHTRNLIWNAYCRFGVGFTTWKHCLLAVQSASAVTNATDISKELGDITDSTESA